jgi:5-methylcytosine-specific restriction enzyme subunit McrC
MKMQTQPLKSQVTSFVELGEWSNTEKASSNPQLRGVYLRDENARRVAAALQGRINIRETLDGLEVETTSFVGSVDVGSIRIVVKPKLPQMPLMRLLRYAYGLRDLSLLGETQSPTSGSGIHDLLAAMLAAEADVLVRQGLAKRHVLLSEQLESPRGRIAIAEITRRGGVVEPRLPCQYFDRRTNWHLNQTLRAGLDMAAANSEDRSLRLRLHRLASAFPEVSPQVRAEHDNVSKAQRELNRLTATYEPGLILIRLLESLQGVDIDGDSNATRIPGYLFDMNAFFQRLVSRFLHDNLPGESRIEDERGVRSIFAFAPGGNPKGRKAPHVRPDYALFESMSLCTFLDAKYRDIWNESYPNHWLYQLAIYALASPSRVSILLYPTMSQEAVDEVVELRTPFAGRPGELTKIILRPVVLGRLAELLEPTKRHCGTSQRLQMATALTNLESSN